MDQIRCLFLRDFFLLFLPPKFSVTFLFPLLSAVRDMNLLKPESKGGSALTKMLISSVSQ